jgi:hypothetical protein
MYIPGRPRDEHIICLRLYVTTKALTNMQAEILRSEYIGFGVTYLGRDGHHMGVYKLSWVPPAERETNLDEVTYVPPPGSVRGEGVGK